MTKSIVVILTLLWIPTLTLAQAPAPDAAQESLFDLSVDEKEKAWLDIGGQQALAFYLAELSGTAHGGVLLIPDTAKHPAIQGTINTMRIALATNHWHTLALSMTDADEEKALKLITAGIAFLNQKGVYNIAILGEGAGAAQALLYTSSLPSTGAGDGKIDQIRALIMINAKNTLVGSETDFLEKLAETSIPVLDAFSSGNYREQRAAKERKKIIQRLAGNAYSQITLPRASGSVQNSDTRITKRIRGWLDSNISGFMVDR